MHVFLTSISSTNFSFREIALMLKVSHKKENTNIFLPFSTYFIRYVFIWFQKLLESIVVLSIMLVFYYTGCMVYILMYK